VTAITKSNRRRKLPDPNGPNALTVCDGQNRIDTVVRQGTVPASTIEAFRYVLKQNDPEQLRAWLAGRRPDERTALRKLLIEK